MTSALDELDVQGLIEGDPDLVAVRAEVESRLDGDPGHDLQHALRVARWALRIGGGEVAPRNVIAAALLHDVVNIPKDSPDRARASELSADVARELLPTLHFDESSVEEIAEAIRDHSYSRGATPMTALGRALQDADRLEALGSMGILRTVAAGVRMGAQLFDADDPWSRERPLDDSRFTLDHFFCKLLELPTTMLTEIGRDEAEIRVEAMRGFLRQLGHELGRDFPGGE